MTSSTSRRSTYHNTDKRANIKLFVVLIVLVLLINAVYNIAPVMSEAESFKEEMKGTILNSLVVKNGVDPSLAARNNLIKFATDRSITLTLLEVKQKKINNTPSSTTVPTARAKYTVSIQVLPFGIYTYNYEFDYTATPDGFLTEKYSGLN